MLIATQNVVVVGRHGKAETFNVGDPIDPDFPRDVDGLIESGAVAEVDPAGTGREAGVEVEVDDELTAGSVGEVMGRVRENPDSAQAVLDAELAGKARKSLVGDLRAFLGLGE